jgi:hypothetical protein
VGHQPLGGHLTDFKNMAVCQEFHSPKKYFNFERHIFGKSRSNNKQFLFEEMRTIDLLWKIVEYRSSFL